MQNVWLWYSRWQLDDEDEDEENGSEAGDRDDADEGTSATKLYRPPKLAAAHYGMTQAVECVMSCK